MFFAYDPSPRENHQEDHLLDLRFLMEHIDSNLTLRREEQAAAALKTERTAQQF